MATVQRQCDVAASPEAAWDAIRDIGAVHTRLAPGFVTDTRLEPGARIVTFINGMVIREPIVTLDDGARRLVWSAQGGLTTHYNAALEVKARPDGGATLVWTADFLPDDVMPRLAAALDAGMRAMKATLDALAR